MGNATSINNQQPDIWWPPDTNTNNTQTNDINMSQETTENIISQTELSELQSSSPSLSSVTNEESEEEEIVRRNQRNCKLQHFKSDLEKKHLARREAIAERSREILFLREELCKYKKENEHLKETLKQSPEESSTESNLDEIQHELKILKTENEDMQNKIAELHDDLSKSEEMYKQNLDLRKSIAETQKDLQAVNSQVLEFEKEKHDYQSHVVALKDVIRVSKKLLEIRENQLRELRSKVSEIEASLAEREVTIMSTDLKDEYERQLENIRSLRALYDQRQAATKAERDLMASQLTDAKNSLENEQKKNGENQERITELEENVSNKYDEIKNLESLLGLSKAEYRGLQAEMSVINQLFSQILFGFNNCKEIDFDKLIKLLEENHDLLTNIIINEESESISSALPKVLLDLVNQVNEEKKNAEASLMDNEENCFVPDENNGSYLPTIPEENIQQDQQLNNQMNSAEEIVNKLPKVWRVLIELLRQQCGQQPVDIQQDGANPCYKSIETPKGPKLVLSVSKTFIRLKDLILEKKSLEKETSRLKQLNTHLEVRLQDQEKRLETVSTELSKTWHVVGRMQKQHQQLHTHEKILRYELGQKRKMLTELKQELEYCREKWEQAREKNSNTEEEWRKLRSEFAARKTAVADESNNSAESGYDENDRSSDDDASSYGHNTSRKKAPPNENGQAFSDTDEERKTPDSLDNSNIEAAKDNNEDTLHISRNHHSTSECATSTEQSLHTNIETTKSLNDATTIFTADETVSNINNQIDNNLIETIANGTSDETNSSINNLVETLSNNIETSEDQLHKISEDSESANVSSINNVVKQISNNIETSEDQRQKTIEESECANVSSINNVVKQMSNNIETSEDQRQKTNEESLHTNVETEKLLLNDDATLLKPEENHSKTDAECETLTLHSIEKQKTDDAQVQTARRKTIPASLDMIDHVTLSSNELLTVPRFGDNQQEQPSTSTSPEKEIKLTSQDERLLKREARLKRLEEQCQQLVTKVTNTNNRGAEICNRLETLHDQYGSDNTARSNNGATESDEQAEEE